MSRILIAAVFLTALVFASASVGNCVTLFTENWEDDPIGGLPAPWTNSQPSNPEITMNVQQGYGSNSTKVLKFWDNNADTTNAHCWTSHALRHVGAVTLQFDCCFPNRKAGFVVRIQTDGSVTTGSSWVAGIRFEGNVPKAPGAVFGDISYCTYTTGTYTYTRTNPVATYNYNTWYTIKIVANFMTRKYDVYKGPMGGGLTKIVDQSDFIRNGSTGAMQALYSGRIDFLSSQESGDDAGSLFLDNVVVTSDCEEVTVATARTIAKNTVVGLYNKPVVAGTDQMTSGSFFYVQEDGVGIRVRSSTVVRQGDLVSVVGTTQRACDSGTTVLRNGEREILASSILNTYGPTTMPGRVYVNNRQVSRGPSTEIDTDGYPCMPGVFASSNGACSGYDQISETGTNNIGRYSSTGGTVVYVDDVNRFFYINDGSNVVDGAFVNGAPSPLGIRVLAPPGVPLSGLLGKSVTVQGIPGGVAQSEAGNPYGSCGNYIRFIRVFRPCPEEFLDYNQNGFWDSGEPYTDINGNGVYDGINVTGVSGPTYRSRFDRYGTLLVNGAAFMPKCLYQNSLDLTRAQNQGFNSVQCFSMGSGDLAGFNARGMKTWPSLDNPGTWSMWMAAKNDNAIAGWYLHDEPEWHGVSAAQALSDFNYIKSQDASHAIGESHADINYFDDYAASDEMCWVDRYPVGNAGGASGIPSIYNFDATARAAHGNNPYYPVWQYVQMFEEAPSFTVPTVAQFRAMIFMGMAAYAKGYFYFLDQGGGAAWQALWTEVANVNSQMDTLRPFMVLPWTPITVTTSDPTYVKAGGYKVGNSVLVIVVNGDDVNSRNATVYLPQMPDNASLTAPIGGSGVTLAGRQFNYTFAPCEVRVLLYGSMPANP